MFDEGSISITTFRLRDLLAVRNLQRRAFPARLAYGMPTLTLLWMLPGVQFLVARRGARLVGCAIGDRSGDLSRVVNIAVDPEARRLGIGEQLLHALELELPDGDMILMVQEENLPAQALYEKTGFRNIGVARNYYGKDQHGIWMRKTRTRGGNDHLFV